MHAGPPPAPLPQPIAPPTPPDVFILPQSDPTQPISSGEDIDEDNLYSALNGNGINDDADDFVSESGAIEDDGTPLPRGRNSPPPYVMQAFSLHLSYVKSCTEGAGNKKKSRVYEKLQSFWMPHSDTFFLLQLPNLTPSLLYNPRFLYWDPLLFIDHIPCPHAEKCGGKLWRHGYSDHPRRCLEMEEWFWMFCARYRCSSCKDPTASFQAWDPRITQLLPKSLAAQLPAVFSHRRAISPGLFAFMRQCFFNGMGAKQFADTINVLHRRKYALLNMQYLQTLHERANVSHSEGKTYPPFLSFEDQSLTGFHGVIPSAHWFRDMYDRFIEHHAPSFDQHTALLSFRGGGIDHSFKVV